MKKTKDSFVFFNFCEALGEKIKKRKKIGKKKILLKTDVVFFFFFHLSAGIAILTVQI